jgi:hypothetical protein
MAKSPVKNHDYTQQGWGHDIAQVSRNANGTLSIMGHGSDIKKNDTLTMKMNSGRVGQFKVQAISYYQDPPDLWNMTAEFVDYTDTVPALKKTKTGETHAA